MAFETPAFDDRPAPPTTPPPPAPQTDRGLLHGIEELPEDEREHYERALHYRPATRQTNRYVRIPGDDYLSRGFLEAVAKESETNPAYTEILQRVERNAKRYANHYQTSDHLGG